MSPPKGYGGVLPSDEPPPPSDDEREHPLRRAERALHNAAQRFDGTTRALEVRMGAVEGRTTGIEVTVAGMKDDVAEVLVVAKAAKSAFNHLASKALALALAGVGASWGLTKVTADKPPAPQVVVQQGVLEREFRAACTGKPDYPPNDLGLTPYMECLVRIARENVPPSR